MTIVDSCGWLEYFLDGSLAEAFAGHLEQPDVLVPTIILYEVYKVVRRDATEELAEQAAALMKTRRLSPLSEDVALLAADLALEHHLALADAVVYAAARAYGASLVTSDYHFASLPGVTYLAPPEA